MTGSANKKAHRQHPHNDEHMVTSSAYYRNRADVDRGLKKRDMPSADLPTVSEKEREEIADAKIAPSNP